MLPSILQEGKVRHTVVVFLRKIHQHKSSLPHIYRKIFYETFCIRPANILQYWLNIALITSILTTIYISNTSLPYNTFLKKDVLAITFLAQNDTLVRLQFLILKATGINYPCSICKLLQINRGRKI